MNLSVYLFSYNRGRQLKNCIRSIEICAPALPTTIIDDNSTDPNTQEVLAKLTGKYRIIQPGACRNMNVSKYGGLYANMNLALREAASQGVRYALFIQDDMQFVRPFEAVDSSNLEVYFSSNLKNFELHTCFMKQEYIQYDRQHSVLDETRVAYHRLNKAVPGNKHFSDVGVFHIERTREILNAFETGELANEELAKRRGARLGFYAFPFMMWLPFPESFRGKQRNLLHRAMETLGGSGFYPVKYMTDDEVKRLFDRDLRCLPVAEKLLVSPDAPSAHYWSTAGGAANTRARGYWRSLMGRILLNIDKLTT